MRLTLFFLLLAPSISHAQQPGREVIETVVLDLNGDGLEDQIRLVSSDRHSSSDPGEFDLIEVEIEGKGVLRYEGVDVFEDDREPFAESLKVSEPMNAPFRFHLTKRLLVILREAGNPVLVVKGYNYGCCPPFLTVLEIGEERLRKLFEHEFLLDEVKDYDGDGRVDFIGSYSWHEYRGKFRKYQEEDAYAIAWHEPFEVLTLSDSLALNRSLTTAYNEEYYVDWESLPEFVFVRIFDDNRKPQLHNLALFDGHQSKEAYYLSRPIYQNPDTYSLDELRLARNEIFARYGHSFSSKDMRTHFEAQPWYVEIKGLKVRKEDLPPDEQKALDLISTAEARKKGKEE